MLKRLKKLGAGASLRCRYEAGPTGFALQRALAAAGIECAVIAPSLVPQKAGDRVETGRRDAVKLARFLRSGDLTEVHVPEAATEAMRDLERCRDGAKRAERTARHQVSKVLLRHGRRYEGKMAWTDKHLDWIRTQVFGHEAHNRVLVDCVQAVENATARVERLTKDIVELVDSWSLRPMVKALQALRGVQVISAVTLVAELGDFARFASAPALMGYLGLVPSEHSSGETSYWDEEKTSSGPSLRLPASWPDLSGASHDNRSYSPAENENRTITTTRALKSTSDNGNGKRKPREHYGNAPHGVGRPRVDRGSPRRIRSCGSQPAHISLIHRRSDPRRRPLTSPPEGASRQEEKKP